MKITAKFDNGQTKEIKNGRKPYTHAFCVEGKNTLGQTFYVMGFSSGYDLAKKAADREFAIKASKYDPNAKSKRGRGGWVRDDRIKHVNTEIVETQIA